MNEKIREAIEYLNMLKGEPLSGIGRGANMLWMGFGKDVKTTNLKGEERLVSEYALHIQCAWRLLYRKRIFTGNGDFYELTETNDTGDWDTKGGNLFDLKAVELNSVLSQKCFTIQKIMMRNTGDLKICLSNGLRLEVFPNDSLYEEYWRFFCYKPELANRGHLVVFQS